MELPPQPNTSPQAASLPSPAPQHPGTRDLPSSPRDRAVHPVRADLPDQTGTGPALKVIVADDDALQRMIISAVLRQIGHEPVEAADGETALALLEEHKARILVCDLNMPGLDGNALTDRIRRTVRDRYVHIIVVTGQNQHAERRRALALGADEFMGKPVDSATLIVRIRAAERIVHHEELLVEKNRILEEAQRIIQSDLRDAARAQSRLLPAAQVDLPLCSFSSLFVPSSYVSGDMLATFDLPDQRTGFYAIDVSGHGVRAALMSVAIGHLVTGDYFARHTTRPDGAPDPAGLARALNERFHQPDSDDYFTLFCGIIDHDAGLLHFCQAGYPPPAILSSAGAARTVDSAGFPVAMFEGAEFTSATIPFGPADTLVLSSDGAIEAESPDGEMFGEARLMSVISAALPQGTWAVPAAIVEALRGWRGGRPLEDDLTVLVCQGKAQP